MVGSESQNGGAFGDYDGDEMLVATMVVSILSTTTMMFVLMGSNDGIKHDSGSVNESEIDIDNDCDKELLLTMIDNNIENGDENLV